MRQERHSEDPYAVAKNEYGEFELILGNRQLLSVFFIVVILLGVFFTMGYIVGRNSAPVAPDAADARKDTKPSAVDSSSRQPEPAPVAGAPSLPPTETAARQPPATEAAKPAEPPRETKPLKAQEPAAAAPAESGEEPAAG